MRGLTVLFLTPLVACGGVDRYLVRADSKLDEGPVVAAIRADSAPVALRQGTFAPVDEPSPVGTRVVKGRGTRHPVAVAGFAMIGAGVFLGLVLAPALTLGSFGHGCGEYGCTGSGDAMFGAGVTFGGIGDALWLAGIPLAATGATRGPELVGFRF